LTPPTITLIRPTQGQIVGYKLLLTLSLAVLGGAANVPPLNMWDAMGFEEGLPSKNKTDAIL